MQGLRPPPSHTLDLAVSVDTVRQPVPYAGLTLPDAFAVRHIQIASVVADQRPAGLRRAASARPHPRPSPLLVTDRTQLRRANIRSKAVSDTDIIQAAAHIVMLAGSQLPSSAMCPAVAQAATPITAPAIPTTSWQVHFVLCVMLITPRKSVHAAPSAGTAGTCPHRHYSTQPDRQRHTTG